MAAQGCKGQSKTKKRAGRGGLTPTQKHTCPCVLARRKVPQQAKTREKRKQEEKKMGKEKECSE